jgi:hypothetical protein
MAVLRLATSARNAAASAVVGLLDAGPAAGTIQIRSGAMPATPQTAATGTLLATVTLADPAAGAAATGVATISDPAAVTGVADGGAFPYWARFLDSTGAAVMDCDVTATGGGGSITLSAQIVTGVTVDIGAITYTQPQG